MVSGTRATAPSSTRAKLAAELARVAEELGVEIFERSPVRRIDTPGSTGAVTVVTEGGRVLAQHAVLATMSPRGDDATVRRAGCLGIDALASGRASTIFTSGCVSGERTIVAERAGRDGVGRPIQRHFGEGIRGTSAEGDRICP